jgi:hypothetical protein
MSSVKITSLSSTAGFPFNTALEDFFNTYEVDKDIECYELFFNSDESRLNMGSDHGGSNFDDLYQIKFKSQIVILNITDSIVDKDNNVVVDELLEFCSNHPENNFIVFTFHDMFIKQINIKNLYIDTIFSITLRNSFTQKLKYFKKNIKSNEWLLLNSKMKLHRLLIIYYLLSKEYYKNGLISVNLDYLESFEGLEIKSKITKQLKDDFLKGKTRFENNEFNLLKIPPNRGNVISSSIENYNNNLLPIYRKTGIEIITGTMFFNNDTCIGEKEIQNVYGKSFPIYITGCGVVKKMKDLFNIDTFDDIIDHSYDEVENPFERLATAIDKNEKLLNGSTNIKELWSDNQKRFEDNRAKVNSSLCDTIYQTHFNEERIKKSLDYFNVSCEIKK